MTKGKIKKEETSGSAHAWKIKEQKTKMGWDTITERQRVVGSSFSTMAVCNYIKFINFTC